MRPRKGGSLRLLLTLSGRFAAALLLLTAVAAVVGDKNPLPPPNILNSAVISVLGLPGLALLISLKLVL